MKFEDHKQQRTNPVDHMIPGSKQKGKGGVHRPVQVSGGSMFYER